MGEGGVITTSPDGHTWKQQPSGTKNLLTGVAYGNNIFVAVGFAGIILTSPDGHVWKQQTSGTTWSGLQGFFSIVYINNLFVATGGTVGESASMIFTSLDGIKWVKKDLADITPLKSLAYGNKTFIASELYGKIVNSDDGIKWNVINTASKSVLTGVAFGGQTFIAVGGSQSGKAGKGIILTSPDGKNWTKTIETKQWLGDIAYGNNTFVAVGDGGTILHSSFVEDLHVGSDLIDRGETLQVARTENHGQIIIPRNIFPKGNGLPIQIHVPKPLNGSNAFCEDENWKNMQEISGENVEFSKQKFLHNLAQESLTLGYDKEVIGSIASVTHALVKSAAEAFEKNSFKITLQNNFQSDFRAVIQILTDEGNVFRTEAGKIISSPSVGAPAVIFSKYLKDNFSLPDLRYGFYQAFWTIAKQHKTDPYVAYLSLNPDKNTIVITPKIYPDDKFGIMSTGIIAGRKVLELRGSEYIEKLSYTIPIQAQEILKVLELIDKKGLFLEGATDKQYILKIEVTPSGSGKVNRYPGKTKYNPGDRVIVTAQPAEGYEFKAWSGDISKPGLRRVSTIIMDTDKAVTAHFILVKGERPITDITPEVKIPKDLREVIFEKSDFATPITLRIPCEDNPRNIEILKSYSGGLPPAGAGSRFIHYPKEIVDILVKHGYMNVERITVSSKYYSGGSQTFEFPKYTDKTSPYVYKITYDGLSPREVEFSKANLEECRKSPYTNRHIRLASRLLKSIDYKDRYTEPATELTPAYDVFTVKFSYLLKKDFPPVEELAGINIGHVRVPLEKNSFDKVYNGEAKAHSRHGSNIWHLDYINLDDKSY